MKKRLFSLPPVLALALLLLLPGCSPRETTADPMPTATPNPSAEPSLTPTPAPTPIVFPTNVERTFSGVMGVYDVKSQTPQDAVCYDALCYYNKEKWGGEYDLTLYALAMLDDAAYTDGDGNLNYVGMMAQYSYYDIGTRLPQGLEPLYSNPLYPNFQPVRFVVRPSDMWCVAVEEMGDGGDPAEAARRVLGDPNSHWTKTFIEQDFNSDWLMESARPVTPTDPDELLALFLENSGMTQPSPLSPASE